MKVKNIKRWFWVHRWTSLLCTLFLLLLCITGLPLIFGEEIEHLVSNEAPYEALPKDIPPANLDDIVRAAGKKYPSDVIDYVFMDDEEPQVVVGMLPDYKADDKLSHSLSFDARTGRLRKDEPPEGQQPQTFIGLMLSLHRDLFLELPGELFIGFMGLLFVVSVVSGMLLYGPFMKKLDFGTIRDHRSSRLKWLDLHNLLGIATAIWLLVIGVTGVFNELSTPLFGLWQMTDVKEVLKRYEGMPTVAYESLSSPQEAVAVAQHALPDMKAVSLIYPGNEFGSPYHYLVWTKGKTPLTARLFTPVLVDAQSGKLDVVVKMPWYLRSLEVSRPLHFGDYGGIPLKILWALFDLVAIVVLMSGVYLWIARYKKYRAYFAALTDEEIT
jgi:uncharacterized iron-regulated membrane protein